MDNNNNNNAQPRSFVDNMFAAGKGIDSIANNLFNLSDAFVVTGNERVAGDLYSYAKNLTILAADIRKHTGDRVSADFKQAEESSGLLLAALVVRT